MLAYLPVLLFVSLGWFLHDPVTLLSSSIFTVTMLTYITFQKNIRFLVGKEQLLLLFLFLTLSFSAILNGENFALALQGNYQRNFGIFFWLSIWLLFASATSGKIDRNVFLNRSLLILAGVSIIYGVIQYLDKDPIPWSNPFRSVQLTLGNPNFAGALVGMISVIVFASFIFGSNFYRRIIAFLSLGSLLIVARGTNSIQAYVVTFISIGMFMVLLTLKSEKRLLRILNYISITSISILGFFFALMLVPGVEFLSSIREKFFYQGSVSQRLDFWRTGISIFKDNPLIGVGPDQFQKYAALYRTSNQVTRDGSFSIPDKAHSVPIDLFANGGLLAGTVWLLFVLVIYRRLFQVSKKALSSELRRDIAILGGVWSGYVFQALISPDQLVLAVIGFICAGLIINVFNGTKIENYSKVRRFSREFDPTMIKLLVSTVLVFSSIVWFQAMRSDMRAKEILTKENLDKKEILAAIGGWPAPKTTELIAVAASGADPNCVILKDISERMIELDERSAQGWYLRAICFNVKQDYSGALKSMDRALEFDPINPVYLVAKAKLGLASANRSATLSALDLIKKYYPDNPEISQIEEYLRLMPN